MNPPSPPTADGPILGLADRENPAVPPGTPRVETPGRQNTLEDRMEAQQREMIRMQKHNNILSSKLHEQQSRSAQLQDGLEQTTQLRLEQSLKSVRRPNDRQVGKRLVRGEPSASRRLFVPTPAEHRREYQIYSDCRDRINDRRQERQRSPIPVQAKLNDRHLDVLGPKSPLRRRYDVIGLEETDESDYIPTSLSTTLSTGPHPVDDIRISQEERSATRASDGRPRGTRT
ncbi:unnamed protein product [Prunus armeniaca]